MARGSDRHWAPGSGAPPAALVRAVADAGLDASGQWRDQEGGQTNRLWHLPSGMVVKLYITDPPNPLFANDAAAEWASLVALGGTGLAPRPGARGRSAAGDWIAYNHVPGRTWRETPGPVAALLRRLHDRPLPDDLASHLTCAPQGAAAVMDPARPLLADLPERDASRLAKLDPGPMPAPPPGRSVLLHGDPVPGNLIVAVGTVTLIDWQCPALGDPTHDLALFLSPGMQIVYRGTPLTAAEEQETLVAYGCVETAARLTALRPAWHWRMAVYCHWKAHRGAAIYARAAGAEEARLTGTPPPA